MRPWRKLHAGIITSDKLSQVSDSAALLFDLLVVAQDDEGKYPWTPAKIKALTVSRSWTPARSMTLGAELQRAGLVMFLKEEGRTEFAFIEGGSDKNGKPAGYHETFIYEASTETAQNFSAGVHTPSPPDEIREDEIRGEGEAGTRKVPRDPRTLDEEKAYEDAGKAHYNPVEAAELIRRFRNFGDTKGWCDKDGPWRDINARFRTYLDRAPKYDFPPSGNGASGGGMSQAEIDAINENARRKRAEREQQEATA